MDGPDKRQGDMFLARKEMRLKRDGTLQERDTKRHAVRRWLNEGNTVQLTVRLRGPEPQPPLAVARALLADLARAVPDVGHVVRDERLEGRSMTLVLAPTWNPSDGAGVRVGAPLR